MSRPPAKDIHIQFACPHCGQKGKVTWRGKDAGRSLVRLSKGFHVEAGRLSGARHVIICDQCDEIDPPRVASFDWHSDKVTRATFITPSYRNTQNVRRFFRAQCGDGFTFDRRFMAWLKAASGKTMGDAANEWFRRKGMSQTGARPPRG
jgi:hypothetical protein